MAKTWSGIIDNGIDQDERKNLISKYPIPTNVRRLKAPLLNEIIMKATSESVVKRDARLADLQNQLAAGISAIGGVIDSMLYEERGGGNRAHLQALCDAGRLLTDVLNMETTARKRLVSYNLDKNIKDLLSNKRIFIRFRFRQEGRGIEATGSISAKYKTYKIHAS